IARDLLVVGNEWTLRHNAERVARLLERAERVLDDPVLQRMERNDRQPRRGGQAAGGAFQESIQPVELAVDPDSKRLERPRRRIDALVAAMGNRAAHDRGELAGRRERRVPAGGDDGARDAPRVALLAELVDDLRQLLFV